MVLMVLLVLRVFLDMVFLDLVLVLDLVLDQVTAHLDRGTQGQAMGQVTDPDPEAVVALVLTVHWLRGLETRLAPTLPPKSE